MEAEGTDLIDFGKLGGALDLRASSHRVSMVRLLACCKEDLP